MLLMLFITPILIFALVASWAILEVKRNRVSTKPTFYNDDEQGGKNTCYTSKTSTGGRTKFYENA